MHIASVREIDGRLLPQARLLAAVIEARAERWAEVVKIGRTHLEDAVPLTVGQEWSGYAAQLRACVEEIEHGRDGLLALALGGTAVGTGLNAPKGFSRDVAARIAALTGRPFATARNKFMPRVRHGVAGPRRRRLHAAPRGGRDDRHGGGARLLDRTVFFTVFADRNVPGQVTDDVVKKIIGTVRPYSCPAGTKPQPTDKCA